MFNEEILRKIIKKETQLSNHPETMEGKSSFHRNIDFIRKLLDISKDEDYIKYILKQEAIKDLILDDITFKQFHESIFGYVTVNYSWKYEDFFEVDKKYNEGIYVDNLQVKLMMYYRDKYKEIMDRENEDLGDKKNRLQQEIFSDLRTLFTVYDMNQFTHGHVILESMIKNYIKNYHLKIIKPILEIEPIVSYIKIRNNIEATDPSPTILNENYNKSYINFVEKSAEFILWLELYDIFNHNEYDEILMNRINDNLMGSLFEAFRVTNFKNIWEFSNNSTRINNKIITKFKKMIDENDFYKEKFYKSLIQVIQQMDLNSLKRNMIFLRDIKDYFNKFDIDVFLTSILAADVNNELSVGRIRAITNCLMKAEI